MLVRMEGRPNRHGKTVGVRHPRGRHEVPAGEVSRAARAQRRVRHRRGYPAPLLRDVPGDSTRAARISAEASLRIPRSADKHPCCQANPMREEGHESSFACYPHGVYLWNLHSLGRSKRGRKPL